MPGAVVEPTGMPDATALLGLRRVTWPAFHLRKMSAETSGPAGFSHSAKGRYSDSGWNPATSNNSGRSAVPVCRLSARRFCRAKGNAAKTVAGKYRG